MKFILRHKDKGEVGETLKDMNYVESVVLENRSVAKGSAQGASLRLTATPGSALVTAHALPRSRDRPQTAWKSKTQGVVRFPSLMPDVYDLAVVAETGIHVGLAVGKDGGKPVDGSTKKALAARVQEIEDFYESKTVLAAVRAGDLVRALVYKTREGKTSLPGDHVFRRWEIWSMHRAGDRWLVDHRAWVFREHGADLPAARKAVVVAELAGHVVKSGVTEVAFTIPGETK